MEFLDSKSNQNTPKAVPGFCTDPKLNPWDGIKILGMG